MPSTPLSGRVAAAADEALRRLAPGPTSHDVATIRRGLDEPLRVAIAGREKTGKSTFVNALLGQNVAPTDASVCTKVVTWFRYRPSERVDITTRAGETRSTPLVLDEDGEARIDLGGDPSTIERVTIGLPLDVLRELTIIDTPGLASLNEQLSDRTGELLYLDESSRTASEKADALIFLLSPTVMADDRQALADFRERFGGLGASAGNAMGVLSRADQLGGGDDPWPTAVAMAERQAQALAGLVSTVVPVVGLLGESSSHFRASDMANLLVLAELDPVVRDDICLDERLLVGLEDCDVPIEARRRLYRLLQRFGLRRALEEIDRGTRSVGQMVRRLEEWSGIRVVNERIIETFRARSDALRAAAALSGLRSVAFRPDPSNADALGWLRDETERLELDPAMHRLNELRAGEAAAAAGASELPADLRADVHRLLSETSPQERLALEPGASDEELRVAAQRGERRWRAFGADARTTLGMSHVADVFARSYSLMYEAPADVPATAG